MRPTPSARRHNTKTKLRSGLIVLGLVLATAGTFIVGGIARSGTSKPAPSLKIAWPTAQAQLRGTQTFKASFGTLPLANYEIYWRVDDSRWTRMQNTTDGTPQKVSRVDVSSWLADGPGPYALEFVAKRPSGKFITRKTLTVTVDPSSTAPRETQVWWPLDGTTIAGNYTFKAVIKGLPLTAYTMSWQVDTGLPVPMADSYDGTPHKESRVNVDGWTWSPTDTYAITFIARDTNGNEIGKLTRQVKVADSGTEAPAPPAPAPAPAPSPTLPTSEAPSDSFSAARTIEETGAMGSSADPAWWVNSGGRMIISNGTGKTIQGSLPPTDRWYQAYAAANPLDTDGGAHPQNIFRLVRRGSWRDFVQEAYFKINGNNFSASTNRAGHNGILLFNRYVDGNNLYYTGLRVDGAAIIKKKQGGAYTTLASKPFIAGTYNRATNGNLMPLNTWIGLRSVLTTNADGSTTIKLYIDKGRTGAWVLAAEARDTNPVRAGANAGIRTDFMDVEFDDYRIQ